MLSHGESGEQPRALIACGDTEQRRLIGDIARAAKLRTVGFIREPDQLSSRTLLSMPDVLLLDIEMFRDIQRQRQSLIDLHKAGQLRIVLCGQQLSTQSTLQWQRDGIDGSLDLASTGENDVESSAQRLQKTLSRAATPAFPAKAPPGPCAPPMASGIKRKTLAPSSVVIGSSTGGPIALMGVLKGLPKDFPLPIAVVQHMPPGFTRMLAERLHAECALRVVEAEAGMSFEPGSAYIAPGGFHMVLSGTPKSPRVDLNTQEPESSCRPAVDVLFRSSAKVYGGRQHAIVLTGMGRDGLLGATQLHGLGARIVVQDAATSTVWGMPGAIAQAGYADDILPLDQIAPQLLRCL